MVVLKKIVNSEVPINSCVAMLCCSEFVEHTA